MNARSEELLSGMVGGIRHARSLLEACQGPGRLVRMNSEEMMALGLGWLTRDMCRDIERMVEFVKRVYFKEWIDSPSVIEGAADAEVWFRKELELGADREAFWVLLLDSGNQPMCRPIMVSSGLLNGTPAGAREIFSEAIKMRAASVILSHNHPGGDCTPSRKDIALTKNLIESSRILGIPILDHIIISDISSMSLRGAGYVDFDVGAKKKRPSRRKRR